MVRKSHLAWQQGSWFACTGGEAEWDLPSAICPLHQAAQGVGWLAYNTRQKGSYVPCASRCLDLRAFMRNRRGKNKAPVESLSWGSAGCCFQAGNVWLANPANQTPGNPSCLADPSEGGRCSPPWASLCPVRVHQGKHSSLSGACHLQMVSLLVFNESKPKNTQKPHNLSHLQSKVFLRPDRIQLNRQWGWVQPAAA